MKFTIESLRHMLAVMEHFENGGWIQWRRRYPRSQAEAATYSTRKPSTFSFDWENYYYEIKKEPRTIWVYENRDGILSGANFDSENYALMGCFSGRAVKFVEVTE